MDLSERGATSTRHPWERVRADFFRSLIADHVELSCVDHLVDIGAGDGWFAHELLGGDLQMALIGPFDDPTRFEPLLTA